MKRTPLKRKKRISPISAARRLENEVRRGVVEELSRKRGHICEAKCARDCYRISTDAHEKLTRARGGSITDEDNILLVCRPCHEWIHANPAEATEAGFLIPSSRATSRSR